VLETLNSRRLSDLETCRAVWESEADPLALVAAVTLCDGAPLPEWLTDVVLAVLTEGSVLGLSLRLPRQWRLRGSRATDAARAAHAAALRAHPGLETPPWHIAHAVGARLASEDYDDLPEVSGHVAKKSWQRVLRGLAHRWRYYLAPEGIHARVLTAWERTLSRLLARRV
jgi:hypothetical protein